MSFIKTRHLKIGGVADPESLRRFINDEIGPIPGVIRANVNAATNILEVTYDVRQTDLDAIEGALEKPGLSVVRNWVQRITRNMIRFMEENERDNATASPSACCSHPDALLQKTKQINASHGRSAS